MRAISATEPDFSGNLIPTRIELMLALNWYNANASEKHIEDWMREWIAERGLCVNLRGRKPCEYKTIATMHRIFKRGYPTDSETVQRLCRDTMALSVHSSDAETDIHPKPTPRRQDTGQQCLGLLDEYTDRILSGENVPTRAPTLFSNIREAEIILGAVQKKLNRLEEEREFHDGKTYRALKAAYNGILKTLDDRREKIKTEKTKAVLRKIKPPGVVAKGVRYLKEFVSFRGLLPEKMVGAHKAYVFDADSRNLMCYISTDAGFTFTGTTLKNIDTERSKKKILRRPEEFFAGTQFTMSALNRAFATVNSKEKEVNGRFNENCLIVCVS